MTPLTTPWATTTLPYHSHLTQGPYDIRTRYYVTYPGNSYLVLAKEDLTNQVEGRALQNKTTAAVCRFRIEDVICRYGCVGKIVADRGSWTPKRPRSCSTG